MIRQASQQKKWLFLPLVAAMILAGIRTGPAAAYLDAFPPDASLQAARLQQVVIIPYHDIITAENLGRNSAESVIACSIRNRGNMIYRITDSCLPADAAAFAFPFLCTGPALRRRNRQLYVRSWIIRYIHDQDGEKDGAFSS